VFPLHGKAGTAGLVWWVLVGHPFFFLFLH
jgi:hypothetical protein